MVRRVMLMAVRAACFIVQRHSSCLLDPEDSAGSKQVKMHRKLANIDDDVGI